RPRLDSAFRERVVRGRDAGEEPTGRCRILPIEMDGNGGRPSIGVAREDTSPLGGSGRKSATTVRLGIAVCQRLEHKRTSLVNRNHGDLEYLISTSTVPLLHDPVDRFSVLERLVAFSIVLVDRLPRRQDENLRRVLV